MMTSDKTPFSTIEEALIAFKRGEFLVVVDDEDRENEGDLIIAAEKITDEKVNFMARFGRGLICTPILQELANKLQLPSMSEQNTSQYATPFTISIDLVEGNTTGISAGDRARTILAMTDPNISAEAFARPGHIFPLVARDEGVLVREGHTEACVDFCRLTGLMPVATLCEIMNDDGSMARMPDLIEFSKQHQLHLVTIKALKEYILHKQDLLTAGEPVFLPTKYGEFTLFNFIDQFDPSKEQLALVKGDLTDDSIPLVRVHSECLTGDLLGSIRCDCGSQLDESLKQVSAAQSGILIYLRQEGRGIGLINKLKAYALQDQGLDTIEANTTLGFAPDERSYHLAYGILRYLGVSTIDLLTNNPEKIQSLTNLGITVNKRISLVIEPGKHNHQYLATKASKFGHMIDFGENTRPI